MLPFRRNSTASRRRSGCAIDWEQPANNDCLPVSQFSVRGELYTCRPDLVAFVNGLPLVVIELKKPGVPARAAFDENLTHYKAETPPLYVFNALLIASNGTALGPIQFAPSRASRYRSKPWRLPANSRLCPNGSLVQQCLETRTLSIDNFVNRLRFIGIPR